jgi:carboxylate-amine ligase
MDRTFSEGERYEATGCALAGLVRTPTCALHVHVGMPDPETMIRVFNGLRAELPLLLALSANSPFWHGADSGLASARTALLRSYPRSGIPQPLPSFEAFLELEERLRVVAEVEDYTHFWWDVRPHPRLGTIEVRVMDVQTRLDWTEALIALVHGLVAAIVAEGARPQPAHEAIEECAFRAARYGVDARLADADGVLQPVPALAREAVDRARRHLPDDRPLDGIASLVAAGGGAQRQRAAFAAGGMRELLRMLISETEEPCLRPS